MRTLTRGLKGGPGRRAMIIAGGAAGVAAAFNTPIAGVVFAFEELARSFERRTHTTVILVVVVAGFTAYALQGDYAYFGTLSGQTDLRAAWLAAPVIGLISGVAGGVFSRLLAYVIGPGSNPVARWRQGRPVFFAFLCGLVAGGAALISGGVTFGAGYHEARALLHGDEGGGLNLAVWKFVASLAAAVSGAPGGIFAPSLATGAGIGSALSESFLAFAGRDAVVLRLAGLYGEGRAPLKADVLASRAIAGSPDTYLNLIHVEDAARTIVTAAASGAVAGRTYNVSDGCPLTREEYVALVGGWLQGPPPKFEGGGGLGKRVRNDRAINELGLQLRHPFPRSDIL